VEWAIAADKVFTVMRQDISVVADPYFYFGAPNFHRCRLNVYWSTA
jgi:hypothetical protein